MHVLALYVAGQCNESTGELTFDIAQQTSRWRGGYSGERRRTHARVHTQAARCVGYGSSKAFEHEQRAESGLSHRR